MPPEDPVAASEGHSVSLLHHGGLLVRWPGMHLLAFLRALLLPQPQLAIENLALRQQVAVLKRSVARPRIKRRDRIFWVLLRRLWPGWGDYRLWGAPRIQDELEHFGHHVAKSTIIKYMDRGSGPPSQTWRAFLRNHAEEILACDFFTIPTATFPDHHRANLSNSILWMRTASVFRGPVDAESDPNRLAYSDPSEDVFSTHRAGDAPPPPDLGSTTHRGRSRYGQDLWMIF